MALVICGLFIGGFVVQIYLPKFSIHGFSLTCLRFDVGLWLKEWYNNDCFLAYSATSLFAVSVFTVVWWNVSTANHEGNLYFQKPICQAVKVENSLTDIVFGQLSYGMISKQINKVYVWSDLRSNLNTSEMFVIKVTIITCINKWQ